MEDGNLHEEHAGHEAEDGDKHHGSGESGDSAPPPPKDQEDSSKAPEPDTSKTQTDEPIKFKDAVGRKFVFSFRIAKTWAGMEELIKQAFLSVEVVGPHVMAGHYDLLLETGEIVLPPVWEDLVKPGSSIAMVMWPMPKPQQPPPPRPRPGGNHVRNPWAPPAPFPPPPGGVFQPRVRRMPGGPRPHFVAAHPPPRMVSPSSSAPARDEVVIGTKSRPHETRSPKKMSSTNHNILAFLSGKSLPGKERQKKATAPPPPSSSSSSSSGTFSSSPSSDSNEQSDSESTASSASIKPRQEALEKELLFPRRISQHRHVDEAIQRATRRPTWQHGVWQHSDEVPPKTTHRAVPLKIRSVLKYCEDVTTKAVDNVELLESHSPVNSLAASGKPGGQGDPTCLTWLHETRIVLSFNEFCEIARSDVSDDCKTQIAIGDLLDIVRRRKRDDDWYIKPGTVARVDLDCGPKESAKGSAKESRLSVIFLSVPYLRSSLPTVGLKPGASHGDSHCVPRGLYEAFDQYSPSSTVGEFKQFTKHGGARSGNNLWVSQAWILITGSALFTYSHETREILEGKTIRVERQPFEAKDDSPLVELMDESRRLFYIPLEKCKTFYTLQIAARDQLWKAGESESLDGDIEMELEGGKTLTAKMWRDIVNGGSMPRLKIVVTPIDSSSGSEESASDQDDGSGDDEEDGKSSVNLSPSLASTKSGKREARNNRKRHKSIDRRDSLLVPQDSDPAVPSDALELDHRVPPFLSWSIGGHAKQQSSVGDAVKDYLARIELGIVRQDSKRCSDDLIEEMYQTFGTDVFQAAKVLDLDTFESRTRSSNGTAAAAAPRASSRFADEQLGALFEEYRTHSMMTLRAFVPHEVQSPIVSKFLGALVMMLENPVPSLLLGQGPSRDDPNAKIGTGQEKGWIISSNAVEMKGFLPLDVSDDLESTARCKECEKGIIYRTKDRAVNHLRVFHLVSSSTDAALQDCILPLREAANERWREEHCNTLRACRDTMASILRKLALIQSGITNADGEVSKPRQGMPGPLLHSFKLVVAFVCAVPHVLDCICWFYKDEALQPAVTTLKCDKIGRQKRILSKLGAAIEDEIRKTERFLLSPVESENVDDLDVYLTSVGSHYLAARIMCNLLVMPIHGNKQVHDLYLTYTLNTTSQAFRYPTKRLIPKIGSLCSEIGLASRFTIWQQESLEDLQLLLDPRTFSPPDPDRTVLFEVEDALISRQLHDMKRSQAKLTNSMTFCEESIERVRDWSDIMKDEQSRAILLFTIVTIVFLPMSFVASYFSMAGDRLEHRDWGALQGLFWAVAGPLTVTVGTFCVGAAYSASLLSALAKLIGFVAELVVRVGKRLEKLGGSIEGRNGRLPFHENDDDQQVRTSEED